MKKAMTVLGLGAAAVAISVSSASAMEQPQQAETTTGINLRQQPSATSNKVTELKAGSKLTVTETKDGWSKVQTDDGQNGWVSGYYVSSEETADQTKADQKPVADNQETQAQVNDNNVNKNVAVNKNVQNETASVKNNEKNVANYIKESKRTVQQENASQKVTSNGKLKSTVALNVRRGPSTSNDVSSVIYKGEIFKVVERASNGWVKVILNDGSTGWASGKYIDLTDEVDNTNIAAFSKKSEKPVRQNQAEDENANEVSNKVKVTSGVNVRSGAGTSTSVIGSLNANSVVDVLGNEGGWYKVRLDNGNTGYVWNTFVTKASSSDVSSSPVSNIKESSKPAAVEVEKVSNHGSSQSSQKVVDLAQSLLGVKYSWGGTTTSGFDCSGFTQYVYKNALGVNIPRVSRDQARAGSAVSVSNAKAGDLLYFDTMGTGQTSHVGIYLGDGKFVHASGTASNPEYVKISSLSERWAKCLGARRF